MKILTRKKQKKILNYLTVIYNMAGILSDEKWNDAWKAIFDSCTEIARIAGDADMPLFFAQEVLRFEAEKLRIDLEGGGT